MKPPAWLLWSLLSVAAWGLWAFLAKIISGRGEWELHPYANHVASTLGLVSLLGAVWLVRGRLSGRAPAGGTAWLGGAAGFLGGLLGSAGNILLYAAFVRGGPAAVVLPLTGLYPLFTVLLAVPLLGERLGRMQVLGVPLALVAAMLLGADPQSGIGQLLSLDLVRQRWYLLACWAILAWGASGFLQKVATMHLAPHAATVAFAGGYVGTAAYCLAAAELQWSALPLRASLVGLVAGVLNGLGLVGLFAALGRGGKASIVVPLTGLYPVVTVALAVAHLGERPGAIGWTGAALALIAGALLARE